ncbi:MAG: alpha/beta hydrolase [Chloroflexota bacterium]
MTIQTIDFGGSGRTLHFSHANGYPPRAYTPLLDALSSQFHVVAAPLRPLWPDSDPDSIQSWLPLAGDLIRELEAYPNRQVVGVGHSVGGAVTLMAALQRPDLFHALTLIDPVIMPPLFARFWQAVTWLNLGARVHPLVKSAQRRRRSFANRDVIFESYRKKTVFQYLDDTALNIYIDALTQPQPDGSLTLRYSPEWEVKIYLTGILDDPKVWRALPGLKVPLLILRGQHTDTFWPRTARRVQRLLPGADIRTIPDSTHLLPLEKPNTVAEEISRFISERFGGSNGINH